MIALTVEFIVRSIAIAGLWLLLAVGLHRLGLGWTEAVVALLAADRVSRMAVNQMIRPPLSDLTFPRK